MTSASATAAGGKKDFNLEIVIDALVKCQKAVSDPPDGVTQSSTDVNLDEYLKAFHELCRFFKLAGPIFAFVAHDVGHKVTTLERFRSSSKGDHYATVLGMITFELETGALPADRKTRSARPCGARTLLRLHWALEFIVEFMDGLRVASRDERSSRIAHEVYERTLAPHHPWLTRKLAAMAVYTLPSVRVLIDVMCKHDYERVVALLGSAVDAGRRVLAAVDGALSSHDLLDLP